MPHEKAQLSPRDLFRTARAQRGQASVEYALVLLAFLATVVGLCALWHQAQAGTLQERARHAASHNAQGGVSVGLLQDLAAY